MPHRLEHSQIIHNNVKLISRQFFNLLRQAATVGAAENNLVEQRHLQMREFVASLVIAL